MQMRVDQARHDGLAGKLDHLRVRPDMRDDRCVIADGNEAAVLDGDRLRDVPRPVDRDDVPAAQHEIGGLGEGRGGEKEREKRETQTHGPTVGRV